MLGLENLQALVHAVARNVRHGHEFDALGDGEVLAGGAGAPASAADEGDLDFIIARRGEGVSGGGDGHRGRGGGEELAAGDHGGGIF